MSATDDRWVEKVHSLARDAAPEDPFELMAEPTGGDPAVMLECILQEFAWMGWDRNQLLSLFTNPGYPMLCDLREHYGDEEIRHQVDGLLSRWGVLRFRETIIEPDEEDPEPVLVQLTLPPKGAQQQGVASSSTH